MILEILIVFLVMLIMCYQSWTRYLHVNDLCEKSTNENEKKILHRIVVKEKLQSIFFFLSTLMIILFIFYVLIYEI